MTSRLQHSQISCIVGDVVESRVRLAGAAPTFDARLWLSSQLSEILSEILIDILATLSAAAAGGMRVALPLLAVVLIQQGTSSDRLPLLGNFQPDLVLGALVSWSLFEVLASKTLLGQRLQQSIQLLFSPLAGAVLAIAVATNRDVTPWLLGILAGVGGMLALVLYLVQMGWFYRLRGLPPWLTLVEDVLCVGLVSLAFGAPREGGLVALILLWLAIRSSSAWYQWYQEGQERGKRSR